MSLKSPNVRFSAIFCMGIALRAIISLNSYSGSQGTDLHGDFEAQRHWQEITVNLPIDDWYQNTTDNDLLYWGLDYPPLTAYHSWIVGVFAGRLNRSYVELHKSRRLIDENHKQFMRNTVLLIDLLLYIPALLIACKTIQKMLPYQRERIASRLKSLDNFLAFFSCIAVFYPGQILIDNGHFQYNNVSLGFTALAVAALISNRNLVGSVLFVMAVNYKQMELYHSLPFFFYLLAGSFRDPDSGEL